jgi:hypothetical protein
MGGSGEDHRTQAQKSSTDTAVPQRHEQIERVLCAFRSLSKIGDLVLLRRTHTGWYKSTRSDDGQLGRGGCRQVLCVDSVALRLLESVLGSFDRRPAGPGIIP